MLSKCNAQVYVKKLHLIQDTILSIMQRANGGRSRRSLRFAATFQDFVDGIAVSTIRSTQMGVESLKNLLPK